MTDYGFSRIKAYPHGKRIYSIWRGMRERTTNPNHINWHIYGGKGISVCPLWKDNTQSFYQWSIENGYQDHLTIDRIDNDKGYSPENCRWVTYAEQSLNTSQNVLVTIEDETKTVTEWCRDKRYTITEGTVWNRINRGWEMVEAITTPKLTVRDRQKRGGKLFQAFGEEKTMVDWSKDPRCAVPLSTLYKRVGSYSWPLEKALVVRGQYDK